MLNEMVSTLLKLDESVWERYVFSKDPYAGKLSLEETAKLCHETCQAASALARDIRGRQGDRSLAEFMGSLGVLISELPDMPFEGKAFFALYEEPNRVFINRRLAEVCGQSLSQAQCDGFLAGTDIADILLAHELYHFYESAGEAAPCPEVTVWRLGPLRGRRAVCAFSELGAMTFAREYLGLGFCPFLLDALLLYGYNEADGLRLYHKILGFMV